MSQSAEILGTKYHDMSSDELYEEYVYLTRKEKKTAVKLRATRQMLNAVSVLGKNKFGWDN